MTTQQRRSELVRERRKQRRNYGQTSKSRRNSSRREMPPMVSRTGMVVSPPEELKRRGKKQLKTRRRYNVSIGSTGAELSFRSVPVPKVGWRVLSFITLVVMGFAFYWLWTSPQFKVSMDRVVVAGIERIDKETLLNKAGILNQPVFLVDPTDLKENLPVEIPALESVAVSVGMTGEVTFDAVERVPVLAWDQESISSVSWVDENGMIFPAIGSSQGLVYIKANAAPPAPSAPVVEEEVSLQGTKGDAKASANAETEAQTDAPVQLLEPVLVKGILNLSQGLPEGSQLVYDGQHGFGWQDPENGWMVYFGKDLDQPELRLRIYAAIVDMFTQKERKPVLISVEYLHAPYYRMEP
jgi:cell division protein FtsQ